MVMPVTFKAVFPVLVSVTDWGAVPLFTSTLPK